MKTSISILSVSFLVAVMMSSCAINKETVAVRQYEINNSKEVSATAFVKYADGSVKYFKSLKLVIGAFTTPHLLGDGVTKISPKEIIAYQNDQHYAISQTQIVGGRQTFVAKETLPGFAVRISKGKVNVYSKKFYNGNAGIDEYFIQAGNDGKIYAYTPDLMKSIIKDNYEAMAIFNHDDDKSDMMKKLQNIADVYNNSSLVTKN